MPSKSHASWVTSVSCNKCRLSIASRINIIRVCRQTDSAAAAASRTGPGRKLNSTTAWAIGQLPGSPALLVHPIHRFRYRISEGNPLPTPVSALRQVRLQRSKARSRMDRFRSPICEKCATTPLFDMLARLATEPKVILQSPSALAKSSPTRRMRFLVTRLDTHVLYKALPVRHEIRRPAKGLPERWYGAPRLGGLISFALIVDSD